jgi:hypothetical protein
MRSVDILGRVFPEARIEIAGREINVEINSNSSSIFQSEITFDLNGIASVFNIIKGCMRRRIIK